MNGLVPVLKAAVLLGGMVTVMVRIDRDLTLVALAVVPLLIVAMRRLGRWIGRRSAEVRSRESRLLGAAERAMRAMGLVQTYGLEASEQRRFVAASRASLRATLALHTTETAYGAVVSLLIAIGTAAVLWAGARGVLAGTLSLGDVLVFTSYLAALYAPIDSLTQTWGLVQGAAAGLRRVLEVTDSAPDVPDGSASLPPSANAPALRLEGVRVRWPEGAEVLRGVDLQVPPGTVMALVGASGAGKSTLLHLVPRLIDPTAGRVLLDGVDVRSLRLAELRRAVAVVAQPPVLLPDTLAANIALGQPGARAAAITEAAHAAQLEELLGRLPHGLATRVGPGGVPLSAGEQLRVTIARALLRDSRMLLLDEPTAALDPTTEAAMMAAIRRHAAGRTVLLVTHRASTLRYADVVAVLDAGRIVRQATPDEVLADAERLGVLTETRPGAAAR